MNGYVLAGGASSRMGCDKARLEKDGWPMAVHLCGLLEQAGFVPYLVRRGPPDGLPWVRPDGRQVPVVREDPTSTRHPLQGIVTALEHARAEVVVVPCDLPDLTVEALACLDGVGVAEEHPLVGRIPWEMRDRLQVAIRAGTSSWEALGHLPRLQLPSAALRDRNLPAGLPPSRLTARQRAQRGILRPELE